jgi:hypothetical protein
MSSMLLSRVPYADPAAAMEAIAPVGEAPAGSTRDAPERRRSVRRKRADGKAKDEPRRARPGEKLRPGAYLDVLI